MKKLIYLLLFLSFFIEAIPVANASHMMGAEITWTCVGQDSFLVKLTLYSDCNGIYSNSGTINFSCATTGASITSMGLYFTSPVDITPVCKTSCTRCQSTSCSFPYGIRRYVSQGLLSLNGLGNCCSIKMSFEQCCRPAAITTGAEGYNFYTEATFDHCLNPGSNSPQFSIDPVSILCVGLDANLSNGASQNNSGNETYTYEWAQPLGMSGTPLSYLGQYDYDKAIYFWGFPNVGLPFPRGLHLDPQTGDIQFRPMKAEMTVMVVKVKVFRNNVKIAELRREMAFMVISCTSNNPPSITTPNNVRSKSVCTGDSVGFDFSTNDPNTNDTVTISTANLPHGAVWTHTNGQSNHPKATLSWKTTYADAKALPYTFYVTAKDNACPISASFSLLYSINVKLKIKGNVTVSDLGCGLFRFGLDTFYKQKLNYDLFIAGKQVSVDSLQNYKFDSGGIHPYILKISYPNNCNSLSDTGIITSDTLPDISLPADTIVFCGTSLNIQPKTYHTKGHVKYYWSTGDTTKVLNTKPILKDTTIKLTIEDASGCKSTDSMKISLLKIPAMIPADTIVYCGTSLMIQPLISYNRGHVKYNWSNGDTVKVLQSGPVLMDATIKLSIMDSIGCKATDSMKISLLKIPAMIPADTAIYCGRFLIIQPLITYNKGHVKYNWSSGDTGSILKTGPVLQNVTIILTAEDSTRCKATDSMKISLLTKPLMIPAYTSICLGSSLFIKPNVSYHLQPVIYKWSTGDTTKTIQLPRFFNNTYVTLTTQDSAGCIDYNRMIINKQTNYTMIPTNLKVCSGSPLIITPDVSFTKGHVSYQWSTGDTNKTITTGRFNKDSLITLSIIDSVGCTAQNSLYLTVIKSPDIIMDPVRYICYLTSTTIDPVYQYYRTDQYITSYKWTRAGKTQILSGQSSYTTMDSGSYVISIADKVGCTASDTIRINKLPAIDTSLKINGVYLTAAPGMKKYNWYWDNKFISTGTTNSYKAFVKGWYFAELIDVNNCVDTTRSVYMSLDGIKSQLLTGILKLYPNPTSGKLMFEVNEPVTGDINLIITNIYGREILNQTFNTKDLQATKEIDISNQPAGTYTLIIRYQNSNFHQLIIKV